MAANNADLIVKTSGQLLTCASPAGPKRDASMRDAGIVMGGAVAIIDSRIVAVDKASKIEAAFEAAETIDAGSAVVCPGLVDAHTHIVYAGERLDEFELKIGGADYLEILASGGGIISTVRHTRQASREELFAQSLTRLDKMLALGTTCVEVKTGYGLGIESELKMLEVIAELDKAHHIDIVPTFLAAHAVPPEFRDDPDGYVELVCCEMLPAARQWYEHSHFFPETPFFADVFTERNAFDTAQTSRIFDAARSLGFKLKAHVDEFTNLGGSRLSIESGAVSIDHLDMISDAEIEILSKSPTVAVVTPTVNFNFGSTHFADARKLIDRGCAVAASTDYNPGSALCPSQQMTMAIACRYQKLLPAEAINAATVNAAHACGVAHRAGSLEVGKLADILILSASDYRDIAFEFGGNSVRTVVKKGKVVEVNCA